MARHSKLRWRRVKKDKELAAGLSISSLGRNNSYGKPFIQVHVPVVFNYKYATFVLCFMLFSLSYTWCTLNESVGQSGSNRGRRLLSVQFFQSDGLFRESAITHDYVLNYFYAAKISGKINPSFLCIPDKMMQLTPTYSQTTETRLVDHHCWPRHFTSASMAWRVPEQSIYCRERIAANIRSRTVFWYLSCRLCGRRRFVWKKLCELKENNAFWAAKAWTAICFSPFFGRRLCVTEMFKIFKGFEHVSYNIYFTLSQSVPFITIKPCCRKETARCAAVLSGSKFAENIYYKFKSIAKLPKSCFRAGNMLAQNRI